MEKISKTDISIQGSDELKQQFCEFWPDLKRGLQLLGSIITNPVIKRIITLAVEIGDAVSSGICGTKN